MVNTAHSLLIDLRDEKLPQKLSSANITQYNIHWQTKGNSKGYCQPFIYISNGIDLWMMMNVKLRIWRKIMSAKLSADLVYIASGTSACTPVNTHTHIHTHTHTHTHTHIHKHKKQDTYPHALTRTKTHTHAHTHTHARAHTHVLYIAITTILI